MPDDLYSGPRPFLIFTSVSLHREPAGSEGLNTRDNKTSTFTIIIIYVPLRDLK